jgi:methionyl-tRNA formyltransferase
MKDHNLKIIFMGTPEFAVPSLKILLENNYQILAVVTTPDKPAGRGQKIQESAVKQFASKHKLPLRQDEKLKDPSFIDFLQNLNPDLIVVVAFRMLPELVWSLPRLGTINLHASLLPDYRGAAPINWVVINGEKETGLTTFFLQKEIDTGKILLVEKEPIHEHDTAGELHDRLMQKGANLLLKTIEIIESGQYNPIDQNTLFEKDRKLKSAPKIYRENCQIQWSGKGAALQNLIRGLSPQPGAWCHIVDEKGSSLVLKIFSSEFISGAHKTKPGEMSTDAKSFLWIAVADGFLGLLSVQLEGKKRMSISEFLRGQQHLRQFSFRSN